MELLDSLRKGGGGGGGRGLFYSGSFVLNMGNSINITVGTGGLGTHFDGNTGGFSSITYGIQNIISLGGNPGWRGGVVRLDFTSIGGEGGNDSGGGGGGGGSPQFPMSGGTGGNSGQGSSGQNGQSNNNGGNGGDGGNGVPFSPSLDPIFSGIPGLGGTGGQGILSFSSMAGGGGGGAGGIGTTDPMIRAQDGTSILGYGKGGTGYGSGGGGTHGKLSNEPPSYGGNGFSGVVVIRYNI